MKFINKMAGAAMEKGQNRHSKPWRKGLSFCPGGPTVVNYSLKSGGMRLQGACQVLQTSLAGSLGHKRRCHLDTAAIRVQLLGNQVLLS